MEMKAHIQGGPSTSEVYQLRERWDTHRLVIRSQSQRRRPPAEHENKGFRIAGTFVGAPEVIGIFALTAISVTEIEVVALVFFPGWW